MKFLITSLFGFIILASSTCFSTQTATTADQPAYIVQDFQPVSIKNQIEEYRLIYDEILRMNPANPYEQHSPRLFSKLENAFKLMRKYIQEKQVLNDKEQEQDQGLYLGYLESLYQAALKLDKNQEMTPRHFERLNAICALIGTWYSIYDGGASLYAAETYKLWEGDLLQFEKRGMAKTALSAGAEQTVNFIKTTMDNSLIGGFERDVRRSDKTNFFPIAILYMDKEIGVGYQTFVNQYFGPYPLFLATFFPSSLPTTHEEELEHRQTKGDVHFSKVVSPFMMLAHDFEHRSLAVRLFADLRKISKNHRSWLEYLRPAYNLIKTASRQEQQVLNAGLFLLIHELQDGNIRIEKLVNFKSVNKFDLLEFVMEEFQNFTDNTLKKRGSDNYKTKYRDNEYVLFWAKNSAQVNPLFQLLK